MQLKGQRVLGLTCNKLVPLSITPKAMQPIKGIPDSFVILTSFLIKFPKITTFNKLFKNNKTMIPPEKCINKPYIFIDVRTPKEYELSTIPGSINIPLFSNEERVIIGKLYKKEGKQKAVKQGFKIISKTLNNTLKKFTKYKNKKLIIFCWRGGMRSRSIVTLLKTLNFNVKQLEHGYKGYRAFIRNKLETYKIKSKIIVIYGYTGSGKTKLINKFKNSLDLEDLAQHRSSLFGSIGLKPRTQKMFESLLYNKLKQLKKEKFIITEGESRKIGDIIIPEFLFKAMKKGTNIKLNVPFKKRVKNIVTEYGSLNKKEIAQKIEILKKFISKKKVELLLTLLKENKKTKVAEILLKDYYDPLYICTVEKMKYKAEIKNIKELKEFLNKL